MSCSFVRLGKWVEIRFVLCELCKNSLIVDWRDQSLPQSRSSWTELGNHFLVCFVFLLSLSFACGFEFFTLITRFDLGVVIIGFCLCLL